MSPRGKRLPQVTAADVVSALKNAGWEEIRQEGSHLRLRYEDHADDLTIPVRCVDMPKGTLNAIIQRAGLTQAAFRELL
jgi:predicted RNA binding protein YcfA (HicA-like mRNA interferase family)